MFTPAGSYVYENEKKKLKNLKIKNFEGKKKQSGDMVARQIPIKLVWILAAVFEKSELTDDGRRTPAGAGVRRPSLPPSSHLASQAWEARCTRSLTAVITESSFAKG